MEKFRYMKIPLNFITAEIMKKYNINDITSNGYVYIEIRKAMYGLKEAGIIAYQLLVKNLAPHGYHPCTHTPGHWKYVTRKIMFNLAVDDFGIKYVHKDNIDHLFAALRQNYEISINLIGAHYCGLTIDWHYKDGYVDISMPSYVMDALKNSSTSHLKKYAPHKWTTPAYGQNVEEFFRASMT